MQNVVDFEKAAASNKLDITFIYDLAQDFYAANNNIIPRIKESLASQDYKAVLFALHSMKNGSHIIGAYGLAVLSTELEYSISHNKIDDEVIAQFDILYELIESSCKECIAVKKMV